MLYTIYYIQYTIYHNTIYGLCSPLGLEHLQPRLCNSCRPAQPAPITATRGRSLRSAIARVLWGLRADGPYLKGLSRPYIMEKKA